MLFSLSSLAGVPDVMADTGLCVCSSMCVCVSLSLCLFRGNLYGTTSDGGSGGNGGTVFRTTPGGTLTTLYSFCAQSGCPDGAQPNGGLIQGADGDFYGTTSAGGLNLANGTAFKMTTTGELTTLYSFCSQSNCTDGLYPIAGLVQGSDGNFYGTTSYGGARNGGTVFKLTPSGKLSTLHSFCSQEPCTDGEFPRGLVQGSDGALYGTTSSGGAYGSFLCFGGCGTVFRITSGGALTTLYSFCAQTNCPDGAEPDGGAGSRRRWRLLRHNRHWRDERVLWHGLQNHHPWQTNYAP